MDTKFLSEKLADDFPTESQLFKPIPRDLKSVPEAEKLTLFDEEEKEKALEFIKRHNVKPGEKFLINISGMQVPQVGILQHSCKQNPRMRNVTILREPLVLTKDDAAVTSVPKHLRAHLSVTYVRIQGFEYNERLFTKELLNRIYLHYEGRDEEIFSANNDGTYSRIIKNEEVES